MLPQELYDAIIDENSSDVHSLRACALVCHSWLPRCRHHLHATLDILQDSDEYQTLSTLYSAADLAQCVRRLVLRLATNDRLWLSRAKSLVFKFPNVRSLELLSPHAPALRIGREASFSVFFSAITSLILVDVSLGSFREMSAFLSALTQLRRFEVADIQWPGSVEKLDDAGHLLVHLQHLKIGRCTRLSAFVRFLSISGCLEHLETLDICWYLEEGVDGLRALFLAAGPCVQDLRMEVFAAKYNDTGDIVEESYSHLFPQLPDLKPFTQLRFLTVVIASSIFTIEGTAVDWLCHVLPAGVDTLRKARFITHVLFPSYLQFIDLAPLDSILAGTSSRYTALEEVCHEVIQYGITSGDDHAEILKMVQTVSPNLLKRGLLRVESGQRDLPITTSRSMAREF